MIEGAITKLPKSDKPVAVKFGWFRESLSKQARLLREASAVGKVVALELNDVDPLTLAVVATTPDLQMLYIGRKYLSSLQDPLDFSSFSALKELKILVLRAARQDAAMPWVSALAKLQVLDIYTLHSTDATVGSFAKLKHLERLVVGDCELSATGWRRLSGLTRLKSLEVTFCEGAIVQDLELERFAHLTSLSLSGAVVTDEGIAGLRGNKNLKAPELKGCKITDRSAEVINSITQLEHLDLEESPVGDRVVDQLADPTRLEWLNLGKTKVTDTAMKTVAGLSELCWFNLDDTAVSNAGVAHLRGLSDLRTPSSRWPAMTDRSIPVLAELKAMTLLNLQDTEVSSAGVLRLTGLKNLTKLFNPRISDEDTAKFKESMPGCSIYS